jgi:hypothetical protein
MPASAKKNMSVKGIFIVNFTVSLFCFTVLYFLLSIPWRPRFFSLNLILCSVSPRIGENQVRSTTIDQEVYGEIWKLKEEHPEEILT